MHKGLSQQMSRNLANNISWKIIIKYNENKVCKDNNSQEWVWRCRDRTHQKKKAKEISDAGSRTQGSHLSIIIYNIE